MSPKSQQKTKILERVGNPGLVIAAIFCLMALTALTACGTGSETADKTTTEPSEETAEPAAEPTAEPSEKEVADSEESSGDSGSSGSTKGAETEDKSSASAQDSGSGTDKADTGGKDSTKTDKAEPADKQADKDNATTTKTPAEMPGAGADESNPFVVDCRKGDIYACDVLFQISEYGSPEEALALSCGPAEKAGDFCTPGLDFLKGVTSFDPSGSGVQSLVADCNDGFMNACDLLFFRSPAIKTNPDHYDAELQNLGNTCGDRVEVALPNCREQLGEIVKQD